MRTHLSYLSRLTRTPVLNLAVSEGRVLATTVKKKKWSLRQLLARVNKKNLHAEVDFGPSLGREIW